jgi:DNA polymerase (family 10)
MAAAARLPEVVEVIASGETKTSVRLKNGLQIDVRVVPVESYGAALNYFTGSKEHNIALRQIAQSKGWKLNEYGLFDGERRIAGATEEDLYAALGLPYIDPELREEGLDVFGVMPRLVGYRDLKGDLQVQTSWSDGAHSIADMAEAAMKCGLDYIAVTDHTRRLAMTGGLDEKRLFEQRREIDALNERLAGSGIDFRILKGSECDILKDGSLDLRDEALATLDVAGVSVHSYFNLPRAEQTERVIRAMKNPHADILFHPTARKINRRPAIDVDMARIIRAAKDTGTIMEIDAFPDRLDLKDEYIKDCVREGVKLAIDSDAHDKGHFSVLEYGIAQARRGRAAKADIINAWPVEVMLASLKGGRPHGTASTRP